MFQTQCASKNILTVSKLNKLARSVLEVEIGQVWLEAQISNFVAASSGHWYFTLKDDRAQIKGAMFKGANRRVLQKPKEGDKVLVRANISLYEPRGDYQIIVEHMQHGGEGQLKQQFEQLKIRLAAEGLFAHERKQNLPDNVLKVGVVTSPTGAALYDILTVLKRRNRAIEIIIYPTQVQGDPAVQLICQAIVLANQRKEVDVLVVGRGGGSLEDLWCFNDEKVARAIFASRIPVVSAVGHEIDISIADFVADIRAPTPSAAAEIISEDQSILSDKIVLLQDKLLKNLNQLQQNFQHRYEVVKQVLLQNHPQKQLEQKSQQVDQLQAKLQSKTNQVLAQHLQQQKHLHDRLRLLSPQKEIANRYLKLRDLYTQLQRNWQQTRDRKHQQLANNSHLLDTVSPLATLSRGYSISFNNSEIVKSVKQIEPGDTILTRLHDGEVKSIVDEVSATKD
jgi:exodeoxyribonuclease VII large subunit